MMSQSNFLKSKSIMKIKVVFFNLHGKTINCLRASRVPFFSQIIKTYNFSPSTFLREKKYSLINLKALPILCTSCQPVSLPKSSFIYHLSTDSIFSFQTKQTKTTGDKLLTNHYPHIFCCLMLLFADPTLSNVGCCHCNTTF